MHHPFVAFCVNQDGQLVITHRRDPQRADPLEMEVDLTELEAKGFDAAARSIGEVALASGTVRTASGTGAAGAA